MEKQQAQIKDFVILPRKIRDDYLEGKLSRNELDVLLWIWLNTNPVNGYFSADYKQLEREFHNRISYDNIRKIISSLRKKQYIYFLNHRGRKGSFPIYPIGFYLKSKKIQTLEYLENKELITSQSQFNAQPETELENKLKDGNHNFKEKKVGLIKQFSMDKQSSEITTSYTDNDNENYNLIDDKKPFKRSANRISYKETVPVESFRFETYEEQRCWEIAKSLGETDMRFILSRLKPENGGFNTIERAWGIFQETPKGEIKNLRKYFNKLIRNLAEKNRKR